MRWNVVEASLLAAAMAVLSIPAAAQTVEKEGAGATPIQPQASPQAQTQGATSEDSLQETPLPDDGITTLDVMVVSGAQPGPGMWKVSKGDHVMYVLGTLSPLPKRMEWESAKVEGTIATAQEVIDSPSVSMTSDIGTFRAMLLLPSLLKARKNPDGKTLQESVTPALYARWLVLKPRYIGSDRGIEKHRPLYAAQELYEAAIKQSGLTQDSIVESVVAKTAKKHKVPVTRANVKLVVEDPKAMLKELNKTDLEDAACFAGTMNRIETDLGNMRARANAWAVGDIDALRALPYTNQYVACLNAISQSGIAAKLGITNLAPRIADKWIETAEAAIAKNQVTFATLPISQVLKPDGYLERLRAKGYAVEAP